MYNLKYFLNDNLKKTTDYSGAAAGLRNMLDGYTVENPVAIMPDFMESNTLPIGTTAIIKGNKAINPAFIGMDIGCGDQLFTMELIRKDSTKKGNLNKNLPKCSWMSYHP